MMKKVRLTEDMVSQIAPENMITDEEEEHVEQDGSQLATGWVVQYIGPIFLLLRKFFKKNLFLILAELVQRSDCCTIDP